MAVSDQFTRDDLPDYAQVQPGVTASTGEIEPAQYHYTSGLRGDSGTMAAASFEGASDPG